MARGLKRSLTLLIPFAALCACEPEEEERRPPADPCRLGVESNVLAPKGFLAGAQFWTCDPPPAGAGTARFTDYQGVPSIVSGGSSRFTFDWEGASTISGRMMILGVTGERGYYVTTVPDDNNPTELDLYVKANASGGQRVLYAAIDAGTGTPDSPKVGSFISIPLNVIRVGGGDVQVNLNWDTPVDLDLHVVDPNDEEIYWAHRNSGSGGELDLDSNPDCYLDNINNENIFWGSNIAPAGEYTVRVDFWSACETAGTGFPTKFRVTVVINGEAVDAFDGSFQPNQADAGGAGSGVEVTRFSYP